MQETDSHLLARFAIHRDEAAFGQLTARHLGLIYHVVVRRTGDRQMAEEISQNVLCAVVRKAAALARHPDRFPAWLRRATLFESSKAMRSEASHQRPSSRNARETGILRPQNIRHADLPHRQHGTKTDHYRHAPARTGRGRTIPSETNRVRGNVCASHRRRTRSADPPDIHPARTVGGEKQSASHLIFSSPGGTLSKVSFLPD
jgi:DNA-directed RNA polymerase specialized sigma24 family protein